MIMMVYFVAGLAKHVEDCTELVLEHCARDGIVGPAVALVVPRPLAGQQHAVVDDRHAQHSVDSFETLEREPCFVANLRAVCPVCARHT